MMEDRMKGINEKLKAIDTESREHIIKIQQLVQPIAHATKKILRRRGVEKGRFRNKRKICKLKRFEIVQERSIWGGYGDVCVYHNMALVMMFDEFFPVTNDFKETTKQYLHFFKEGPWMEEIIELYHQVMLETLKKNFNIVKGESE